MIPFEDEPSLTASEEYAQSILESNWDQVVRTTPGMVEDLEQRFPRICEIISREIRRDAQKDIDDVFRPGVPDFLVFSDKGDYKFVEVKKDEDGLRHTQLEWIAEFRNINAEIWFTTSEEVDRKLDADRVSAYTFEDRKGKSSEHRVVDSRDSNFLVELPKTLASIVGLEDGEGFEWRLKSKNELILDSK
ncbi:hypothetical protein GLT90_00450 [Nanohaloarchaea archaeon H12]|nr:hypothetical protein [Nanohaloarchaea archaeon H12]